MTWSLGLQFMHAVLLLLRGFPGNHLFRGAFQQPVQFLKTRVHVTGLFPGIIRLNDQGLAPAGDIARSPQLGMQQPGHQGEQRRQGNLQGCLGIDPDPTGLAIIGREEGGDRMGTDLFTFWPPGPLERLKEMWPRWRGMDWAFKERSHRLASSRSEESGDLELKVRNHRSAPAMRSLLTRSKSINGDWKKGRWNQVTN